MKYLKKTALLIIALTMLLFYSCVKDSGSPTEKSTISEGIKFFSPTELKASVFSDSTIKISWKDNSNTETMFQVQRKSGAETYKTIKETAANDTVLLDNDVSANVLYTYRIRAVSKIAETSYSDEVTIKLDLPVPALTANKIDDSTVKLTWTDNSALETNFILEKSKDGQAYVSIAVLEKNVRSFTDINIDVNSSYQYRIKAKNKQTETAYSNIALVNVKFQAPLLNSSLPQGNIVNLSWNDNSQFEKGYIIEQAIDDGSFSELARVDSQTLIYKIENLQISKKYAFRVKAYSIKNNSPYSNLKRLYFNDKRYITIESYNGESSVEGQIALSPSNNLIATTNYESPNVIYTNRSNSNTTVITTNHKEGGYSVKFSPDNNYLIASGSKDGNIEIWNTSTLKINKTISTGFGAIYCLTFNKTGSLLAVGGTGGSKILIYSFPEMTLKYTLINDNINVRDVLFYENDTKLISAGNDNKIHVWNLSSSKMENTFVGHTGHIGTIDLNKNSSQLVSGSYEDKTLRIWSLGGNLIKTVTNSANISTVFFDSDDNIYFTDLNGSLHIINKQGTILFETSIGSPIYFADFNEAAKIIATYSANGAIKVLKCSPAWIEY